MATVRVENKLTGLLCPECGHNISDVKDSRPLSSAIRRRRKCSNCGHRYTTHEVIAERTVLAEELTDTARRNSLVSRLLRTSQVLDDVLDQLQSKPDRVPE